MMLRPRNKPECREWVKECGRTSPAGEAHLSALGERSDPPSTKGISRRSKSRCYLSGSGGCSWYRAMESPSTDAQLVAAALSGRLSAFEALVVRHQDRLYLQALSYLRAEEDARDALQDAFLKAFRQLGDSERAVPIPGLGGADTPQRLPQQVEGGPPPPSDGRVGGRAGQPRRASGAGGYPPRSVFRSCLQSFRRKASGRLHCTTWKAVPSRMWLCGPERPLRG